MKKIFFLNFIIISIIINIFLNFNLNINSIFKFKKTIKNSEDNKHLTIGEATSKKYVINYIKKYKKLPTFYITKKKALYAGWNAKKGDLCKILPNKAIGGDRFYNHYKLLPNIKNRKWYEADINYNCGKRGSERLLYSSDGIIFITNDHYHSFNRYN
ncbi:Ribonuclease domain-containing protein [Candidatus Providencia siddallii]|uniref:Ribonuclease n=1 Tax=Candidatus Providencia siddallii TaxID=1715285 RepID=A0A0M6W9C5_9GAMM|nr:Ribonuclease domain-containing protein [Candidatus Providencia siddallii]